MSGADPGPLVVAVIQSLATIEPRWTLTGGGALVHVHLRHRTTKDLDLFWHGLRELGALPAEVERRLVARGLAVTVEERSPGFVRLRVEDSGVVLLIDLVATPVVVAERPIDIQLAGVTIQVDTPHEILTNKLTALLSRSELRDLVDIRALLAVGGDLDRALRDAVRKDGGFSPATLAWVIESFPLGAIARREGLDGAAIDGIEKFRRALIEQLTNASAPE